MGEIFQCVVTLVSRPCSVMAFPILKRACLLYGASVADKPFGVVGSWVDSFAFVRDIHSDRVSFFRSLGEDLLCSSSKMYDNPYVFFYDILCLTTATARSSVCFLARNYCIVF